MSSELVTTGTPLTVAAIKADFLAAVESPGLTLNPSQPMPADFNEDWANKVEAFKSVLIAEAEAEVWRNPNGMSAPSRFLNKHWNILQREWVTAAGAGLGAILLFGGVFLGVTGTGIVETLGLIAMPLGLVTAFGSAALSNLVGVHSNSMRKKVLESRITAHQILGEVTEGMYQLRVSQWAQERYGVTMKNRWDSQVKRLAEDLVYVGDKDGRRVYCRETDAGWVLTFDGGEELPIMKELVNV